jgi:hypothetical protein
LNFYGKILIVQEGNEVNEMIINPCKDCPNRHCACSSTCEKYAEWRKEYDAEKKWLQDNKYRFSTTHNKPFLRNSKSDRERKQHTHC